MRKREQKKMKGNKKWIVIVISVILCVACVGGIAVRLVGNDDLFGNNDINSSDSSKIVIFDQKLESEIGELPQPSNLKYYGYDRTLDPYGSVVLRLEYEGKLNGTGRQPAPSDTSEFVVSFRTPRPVDIRMMEYVVIDFYTDRPEVFNCAKLAIELTSSGGCVNERNFNGFYLADYIDGGEVVSGWNVVKIPILEVNYSSGSGIFDPSEFDYIRLRLADFGVVDGQQDFEYDLGSEGMIFGLRELSFIE